MAGLIIPFNNFVPRVDPSAFIAPNATLIGDVDIAANASIWFTCVLRGDGPGIRIGENSNIQDGTVIHIAARGVGTVVGKNVSVGHMALLHACTIEDDAFVGMHATVLDNCVVESGAVVAAGALVPPNKVVKAGELWAGNPASKMRDVAERDLEMIKRTCANYVKLSRRYLNV